MSETNLKELLERATKRAETKYDDCPECEELAAELFKEHPEFLEDAREANIKFLKKFSEKSTYLGKCSRTTGKWAYLTNFDFVIEVWDGFWVAASYEQKKALLFHELLHIQRKETQSGKLTWRLRRHDIEEFHEVARCYGTWTESLRQFAIALQRKEEESNEG